MLKLAIAITCTLLAVGCATKLPLEVDAAFKHPLFTEMQIESITILPVVDHRLNKTLSTELDKNIHRIAKAELERRGYKAELVTNQSLVSKITPEDLLSQTAPWLQSLPVTQKQWVMIIVLHELYRTMDIGATGYASVAGYIYNTTSGEKIWEGRGQGQIRLGYMMAALVDDAALEISTGNLMAAMPIHRGRSK